MPMYKDKTAGLHRDQRRIGIKNSSYNERFNNEEIQFVHSNTKEDISKRHAIFCHVHRYYPGIWGPYNIHTYHCNIRHSTNSGAYPIWTTQRKEGNDDTYITYLKYHHLQKIYSANDSFDVLLLFVQTLKSTYMKEQLTTNSFIHCSCLINNCTSHFLIYVSLDGRSHKKHVACLKDPP